MAGGFGGGAGAGFGAGFGGGASVNVCSTTLVAGAVGKPILRAADSTHAAMVPPGTVVRAVALVTLPSAATSTRTVTVPAAVGVVASTRS